MKQGDFTLLAKAYINRPGYSLSVLQMLARNAGSSRSEFKVADVGAGTGKLTENLSEIGLSGHAVEPNDAMREEGMRLSQQGVKFDWRKGSGEETNLPDKSVDWVLMGSSFHWTDAPRALKEFRRILKPGGYFTAIWNPRDLERSELQQSIDKMIHSYVPTLNRVSSGSKKYTEGLEETLTAGGTFSDLIFVEATHEITMDFDRYMGAWRSVNDIRAQAGEAKFNEILSEIENMVRGQKQIVMPYRTRAWTVRVC